MGQTVDLWAVGFDKMRAVAMRDGRYGIERCVIWMMKVVV